MPCVPMFQYMLAIGPLKFGSRDQILAQKIYIMGYNFKNSLIIHKHMSLSET